MSKCKIIVADNGHYQDESFNYELGDFSDLDTAIAACRKIVDEYLASAHEEGMTPDALYDSYVMFGEDPYIVGADCNGVPFSAWTYAKSQCSTVCA